MIDSMSNDFHSDDRCPMCGWNLSFTMHRHAAVKHGLRLVRIIGGF